MTNDDIKLPGDIISWMDEHIAYGWMDLYGKEHIDEMKDFKSLYRTMSVEEAVFRGLGVCIEQVEIMKRFLDRMSIANKMFCCRIYKEGYPSHNDEHMHCFLLYFTGREIYQIEHPNVIRKGLYRYVSEKDAVRTIVNYYIQICSGSKGTVTEFEAVRGGMSFEEFNRYLDSLPEYMYDDPVE